MYLLDLLSRVSAGTLQAVWSQWSQLGATAADSGVDKTATIVDIESLLLYSLGARDDEVRLDDFIGWFVGVGSRLISVQRMRNAAGHFPAEWADRVSRFALIALNAGDGRWRQLAAGTTSVRSEPRPGKGLPTLPLLSDPLLMLRLRSAMGVGTRADVLCYLLTLPRHEATVAQATEVAGYSSMSVRSALNDLAAAGFVEHHASRRDARYRVDRRRWAPLLAGGDRIERVDARALPEWRHWFIALPLAAHLLLVKRDAIAGGWSEYVVLSRTRDVIEQRWSTIETLLGREVRGSGGRDAEGVVTGVLAAFDTWLSS